MERKYRNGVRYSENCVFPYYKHVYNAQRWLNPIEPWARQQEINNAVCLHPVTLVKEGMQTWTRSSACGSLATPKKSTAKCREEAAKNVDGTRFTRFVYTEREHSNIERRTPMTWLQANSGGSNTWRAKYCNKFSYDVRKTKNKYSHMKIWIQNQRAQDKIIFLQWLITMNPIKTF